MDFQVFQALIRQLERPEIIRLNYSGESTHYPHLEQAIRMAKSTGAVTELVSAFASVSQRTLVELLESGLDRLSVSLHTMDPRQYGQIYRYGSLDLLKARLDELLRLKRQRRTEFPKVDFAFVAMDRNLSQLGEVAAYAREKGVSAIFIHPIIRRDPVSELFSEELIGNRLTGKFRRDLGSAVASAQAQYPEVVFTVCNPQVNEETCLSWAPQPFHGSLPQGGRISTCEQSPWDSVHILANGDVTVCEVLDKVPLGNLARQTLREIWEGSAYREFRLQYIYGSKHECRECPWKVAYLPSPTQSWFDARQGMSPQLLRGWHFPQNETVVWSKGESTLCLKSLTASRGVRIRGILPHSPNGQENILEVHANGALLGSVGNDSGTFADVDRTFSYSGRGAEIVQFRLTTRTLYRPSLHGLIDNRDLGFGLLYLELF